MPFWKKRAKPAADKTAAAKKPAPKPVEPAPVKKRAKVSSAEASAAQQKRRAESIEVAKLSAKVPVFAAECKRIGVSPAQAFLKAHNIILTAKGKGWDKLRAQIADKLAVEMISLPEEKAHMARQIEAQIISNYITPLIKKGLLTKAMLG